MDDFSLAAPLDDECTFSLPTRRQGMPAGLRLLRWRMRTRLLRLGRAVFRLPSTLRTRFLLFAALMVALVVVQGTVGWNVAERSQAMGVAADQAVSASMGDLDLLRTIKNMQVHALVTQNLVSTAAADDPNSVRLDVKRVAKDFAAAHAELVRITAARHMTTLGGINDVAGRIDSAKSSFDQLHARALEAVDAAAKNGGRIPSALTLEISGRVDGLYEHLDRMAEGVDLLAGKDKKGLVETLDRNTAVMKTFQWTMLAAGTIGLLACAVVTAFVLHGILGPLSSVAAATQNLAQGRIRDTIPEFFATEIAAITGALEVFRANLLETEHLKAEREAQQLHAAEEKRRMMHQLADSFETSIKGVVNEVAGAATRLRSTATDFSRAADAATSQAGTVAAASELAASNVNTVAAAAEQLAGSIEEINRQAEAAATFAGQAVGQATRTNQVVCSLAEAVGRIGTVVDLISDIARRTNMLAMNATIEAARAGEFGMGFAVVAGEVKTLSSQTAGATTEIATQIRSVQNATEEAVAAISGIAGTISRISDISGAISMAVGEQQAATAEISRSVLQAAEGTQEVSFNIVGVNETAQDVGSSADELLAASAGLSHQSEALRAAVDAFLAGIREDGPALQWGDAWLTGNAAIDNEHRSLVQHVNDLGEAMAQGRDREILGEILAKLIDYTRRHFAHEEAIWEQGGLPDLARHRQAHAVLASKVMQFHAEFTAGRAELTVELMAFLREWLIDHVFKMDKADAKTLSAE